MFEQPTLFPESDCGGGVYVNDTGLELKVGDCPKT